MARFTLRTPLRKIELILRVALSIIFGTIIGNLVARHIISSVGYYATIAILILIIFGVWVFFFGLAPERWKRSAGILAVLIGLTIGFVTTILVMLGFYQFAVD